MLGDLKNKLAQRRESDAVRAQHNVVALEDLGERAREDGVAARIVYNKRSSNKTVLETARERVELWCFYKRECEITEIVDLWWQDELGWVLVAVVTPETSPELPKTGYRRQGDGRIVVQFYSWRVLHSPL